MSLRHRYRFAFLCLALIGLSSCSKVETGFVLSVNPFDNTLIYFSSMESLEVEVAYEPGAEPYIGSFSNGKDYWSLLEDNLKAIFQGRAKTVTITVPKDLASMTLLPAQNKASWTAQQLVDLSEAYRHNRTDRTKAYFFIAFVKGYMDNEGTPNPNIIGASVGGTSTIGMFKQVITSTGANPNGPVPKYVEQSTMIHEMGHALGLVNNGVPMTSAHQDTANGHHCTNTQCAMYWSNSGLTSLQQFLQNVIQNGTTVMLGSECLDDTKNYQP